MRLSGERETPSLFRLAAEAGVVYTEFEPEDHADRRLSGV